MPLSRKSSHSIPGSSKATLGLGSTSGETNNHSLRAPRPRPRFSRTALRTLEEWVSSHRQSPYPTPGDLDHLTAKTGLKRSQISNWFANIRKRGKVPKVKTCRSPPLDSVDIPLIRPSTTDDVPLFHRWLDSWTEYEEAALPAILQAVSQLNSTSSGNFLRGSKSHHRQWSQSSVSSMEVRSYAANVESVRSDEWKAGDIIPSSLVPLERRHRRLPDKQNRSLGSEILDSNEALRKFQCTFCAHRFRTKYDWQRHEKSMHLPLEKWICSPNGGIDVNPNNNEITCAFCGALDPSPEHIGGHGYATCASRPLSERTFCRKDHLRQHLRLMHGNSPLISSMEAWKSVTVSIRSRCGFCDASLSTWSDRVDHLADHFSDGYSIAENWWGDWGFDDDVLRVLERASLPGKDRNSAVSGNSTAPNSMMDDSYADSLGVDRYVLAPYNFLLTLIIDFVYSTESFAEYPFVDFNDSVFTDSWGGSLDLPVDFFNFDFSHVKSNDNISAHQPFLSCPNGGVEYELCEISPPFNVQENYHDISFEDHVPIDLVSGFT
ncbi:MAG: hypothetical protein CL912_12550 [Deltaproteobacteria bacterium]|nr:hypothetical protein [Deltaproteobacteria bacterium]